MHFPRAVFLGAVMALAIGVPLVHAQAPIRIGASLFQNGSFANLGQNQLRGYQLCVKNASKKVIVWPDELAPDRPRFPTPAWKQCS